MAPDTSGWAVFLVESLKQSLLLVTFPFSVSLIKRNNNWKPAPKVAHSIFPLLLFNVFYGNKVRTHTHKPISPTIKQIMALTTPTHRLKQV